MAAKKIVLTDSEIQRLETMAGLGLKVEQMAAILGMGVPRNEGEP